MQSVNSPSFLVVVFPTVVFSSLLLLLIRLLTSLAAAVSAQQKTQFQLLSSAFTSCMSSAIQYQHHQLSAITAAHPPAWSVGSC